MQVARRGETQRPLPRELARGVVGQALTMRCHRQRVHPQFVGALQYTVTLGTGCALALQTQPSVGLLGA